MNYRIITHYDPNFEGGAITWNNNLPAPLPMVINLPHDHHIPAPNNFGGDLMNTPIPLMLEVPMNEDAIQMDVDGSEDEVSLAPRPRPSCGGNRRVIDSDDDADDEGVPAHPPPPPVTPFAHIIRPLRVDKNNVCHRSDGRPSRSSAGRGVNRYRPDLPQKRPCHGALGNLHAPNMMQYLDDDDNDDSDFDNEE